MVDKVAVRVRVIDENGRPGQLRKEEKRTLWNFLDNQIAGDVGDNLFVTTTPGTINVGISRQHKPTTQQLQEIGRTIQVFVNDSDRLRVDPDADPNPYISTTGTRKPERPGFLSAPGDMPNLLPSPPLLSAPGEDVDISGPAKMLKDGLESGAVDPEDVADAIPSFDIDIDDEALEDAPFDL